MQNTSTPNAGTKRKSVQDLKKPDDSFVLERPQPFNTLLSSLVTPPPSSESLLYNLSSATTVGAFLASNTTPPRTRLNCK